MSQNDLDLEKADCSKDKQVEDANQALEKQAFEDLDESRLLTAKEKRALTWKLDLCLLPIVFLIYCEYIVHVTQILKRSVNSRQPIDAWQDRVAVGAAAAYGFRADLGITGNTYNIGIALFYIFYCITELPSNLILKKVSARIWLPIIGILYGVCSLATGFIHNKAQFLAMRVLLGITESGTLPGCAYYMSTFYDREEFAGRFPIFISASALATAVGNLLATAEHGIGRMTDLVYGWRNIFVNPDKTSLLNERERNYIMTRSMRLTAGFAKEEATKSTLIFRAFTNPSVWFGMVPWFVAQVLASSLTFFLSIILKEQFGYSSNEANIHTAACFFVAFGVTIIMGFIADRSGLRGPWVLLIILLSLMGMALFSYAENPKARYAGAFFGAIGIFGGTGINTAWTTFNCAPYTTRAAGSAISISIGSLGGIVGAFIFREKEREENYPTGARVTLGLLSAAAVIVVMHEAYCWWENKQRAAGKRDYRLQLPPDQVELLGNLHPHFKLAL